MEIQEPKIVKVKVWHGASGVPLYYGLHDGSCYDCSGRSFVDVPEILKELVQRPATPQDVPHMIFHDILDDEDVAGLKSAGIIDPSVEQIYQRMKSLRQQVSELQQKLDQLEAEDDDWVEDTTETDDDQA